MKYLAVSVFLVLFITGCSSVIEDNYSGYLYYGDEPLKNIEVIEQNTTNFTYTSEKGYFKLKRDDRDHINGLVVLAGGSKQPDTISLLRGGVAGSERYYLFLGNRSDTCDIERERIFKQQSP